MNDEPDAAGRDDATESGDSAPDVELSPTLHRALADVEPVSDVVRRSHLDAALAEFDRLPSGRSEVTDLTAARARRSLVWLPRVAVAAALVLVAGIGLRLAANGTGGSSDDSAETATVAADAPAGAADSDASAERGLSTDTYDATAESGSAGVGNDAAKQSSDDAVTTTADPLSATAVAPSSMFDAAQAPDLGDYTDAGALADAVELAARESNVGPGAQGPPTTPAIAPDAPAPVTASVCVEAIARLGSPRYRARLDGRDLIAAPAVSVSPGHRIDVVHLDDCSPGGL